MTLPSSQRHRTWEGIVRAATAAVAAAVLLLVLWMGWILLVTAWPAIQTFGLGFLLSSDWNPVRGLFGGLPFIYGTLVTSFTALLLATPIGLGAAIALSELLPYRWRLALLPFVELLAAVPSVVYGLWGIFVLVPFLRTYVEPPLQKYFGFLPLFQGPILGLGYLAAGVILAIMILPTITSISASVLQAVPSSQKEAILALGATRWEAIRMVIVPYARSGIIGAIMLGLGRAIGETMAVTMVIGNAHRISVSLFAPGNTIASVIANEFAEAVSQLHSTSLIYLGLILFVITLLLNMLARWLVARTRIGKEAYS
ncbi:MAG: phosphate ABC transporter permease subunit PstC [Clostridiales bacterium]|nr:phosphate ABC transporter permease subunit PstC [Clostridiales bacterium]